jgi:FkbM family methyltransferase
VPPVDSWHHLLNDRWVIDAVFPGLRGGYFVEAGACGGKHQSATYLLETELGWEGICVEPVTDYYRLLVQTRRCRTDDRCLWNTSDEFVPFARVTDDVARSGVADVNKNLADGDPRSGAWATTTVPKRTVTLVDLLTQHRAPPTIHYLGLDVEGAERKILEAFDFAGEFEILAVSIESDRCDDLLLDAGYVPAVNPFAPEPIDHYFLHPSLAPSRPDLLRDTT